MDDTPRDKAPCPRTLPDYWPPSLPPDALAHIAERLEVLASAFAEMGVTMTEVLDSYGAFIEEMNKRRRWRDD